MGAAHVHQGLRLRRSPGLGQPTLQPLFRLRHRVPLELFLRDVAGPSGVAEGEILHAMEGVETGGVPLGQADGLFQRTA